MRGSAEGRFASKRGVTLDFCSRRAHPFDLAQIPLQSGPSPAGDKPPATAGEQASPRPPYRPAPKPLLRPRRVRGGVKLSAASEQLLATWASQRWLRVTEAASRGEAIREGLEYAKLGQTKRLVILPGRIEASVQGRMDRPYVTLLRVEPFSAEQWEKVVAAMSEGAMYAAKLHSGELPANIEDLFAPLGMKLFPTEPREVTASCTCSDFTGIKPVYGQPTVGVQELGADAAAAAAEQEPAPEPGASGWCKHICCAAYLFAERLASEPFVMFAVRGVAGEELMERLKDRRSLSASAAGAVSVYQQRIAGVSDVPGAPLKDVLATYWDVGQELDSLDIPLEPPAVSHPLLRRLGPSPMTGAQFPLVGLLASCYETISRDALNPERTPVAEVSEEDEKSDEES